MSNQSALANHLAYVHGEGGWEAVAAEVEKLLIERLRAERVQVPIEGRI